MQRRLSTLMMAAQASIQSWLTSLRALIPTEATYRPEKHYMRGPRQK